MRLKPVLIIMMLASTHLACGQNRFMIPVWPEGAPGAIKADDYPETTEYIQSGAPRIGQVSDPTLTVFLPSKEKATGAAVVICPGGGYARLAIDHEGWDIAVWLRNMGVAGIVLKYRLPTDKIMKDKKIGPLQDAQEAIRIVRRNAEAWGIDPEKVGVMGFSAGGHLAATLSTQFDEQVYTPQDNVSARPDFSILIYPVISMKEGVTHEGSRENLIGEDPDNQLIARFSNELQIDEQTPPAFLVHAADDKAVPVSNSLLYFEGLRKYETPAELHIYESGGHGFGLGRGLETAKGWADACKLWLTAQGAL